MRLDTALANCVANKITGRALPSQSVQLFILRVTWIILIILIEDGNYDYFVIELLLRLNTTLANCVWIAVVPWRLQVKPFIIGSIVIAVTGAAVGIVLVIAIVVIAIIVIIITKNGLNLDVPAIVVIGLIVLQRGSRGGTQFRNAQRNVFKEYGFQLNLTLFMEREKT